MAEVSLLQRGFRDPLRQVYLQLFCGCQTHGTLTVEKTAGEMVSTSPENGNDLPMSIDNPEGNENCPPDSASTDEKLNHLLDVVEDQQETIRQQQEQIEELRGEVEQLRADADDPGNNDETEEQEDLQEEIERLRKVLYSSIENRKELRKEVEKLRSAGTNSSDEATTLEPQTPVEDLVTTPERVLDDENPKRARFVAKDIKQYSHSVPAGRGIKAGEIRRVLAARKGGHVHTGTLDRVIRILDDTGKDEVEVGRVPDSDERIVVFSEECVARIERLQTDHTVVIGKQGGAGETA